MTTIKQPGNLQDKQNATINIIDVINDYLPLIMAILLIIIVIIMSVFEKHYLGTLTSIILLFFAHIKYNSNTATNFATINSLMLTALIFIVITFAISVYFKGVFFSIAKVIQVILLLICSSITIWVFGNVEFINLLILCLSLAIQIGLEIAVIMGTKFNNKLNNNVIFITSILALIQVVLI